MAGTGDGRASWLTDQSTDTTGARKAHKGGGEEYGSTVTGDPRAAFLGGHAGEVQQVVPDPSQPKEQYETLNGDPRRAAFAAGQDTTAAGYRHQPVDTGIHAVGTGDPRAAWVSNAAVDPVDVQEERDIRRAIAASLKDQNGDGGPTGEPTGPTGDARASWLQGDTAQGGRHNWQKKRDIPPPGDIQDPRAYNT